MPQPGISQQVLKKQKKLSYISQRDLDKGHDFLCAKPQSLLAVRLLSHVDIQSTSTKGHRYYCSSKDATWLEAIALRLEAIATPSTFPISAPLCSMGTGPFHNPANGRRTAIGSFPSIFTVTVDLPTYSFLHRVCHFKDLKLTSCFHRPENIVRKLHRAQATLTPTLTLRPSNGRSGG